MCWNNLHQVLNLIFLLNQPHVVSVVPVFKVPELSLDLSSSVQHVSRQHNCKFAQSASCSMTQTDDENPNSIGSSIIP